jgi:hypothetical protein
MLELDYRWKIQKSKWVLGGVQIARNQRKIGKISRIVIFNSSK